MPPRSRRLPALLRTLAIHLSALPALAAPAPAAVTKETTPPAASPVASPIDALVGRPPPPLTVGAWIKGPPLDRFETGRVYVVDFWATWCGPCRAAIPHLTELARAHPGKLEVIGVSISEKQDHPTDTAYVDRVREFVTPMGDRMDYRVAVDTTNRLMHATWFEPTGTGGIPTAYILGPDGRIAWAGIGAPDDIERITGEVLAGTFQYPREAERRRQLEAEARKRSEADIAAARGRQAGTDARYPGYRAAMERGDTAAALASLDAAFAADPTSETAGAYQWKLMLLLQRNQPAEVDAYARHLLREYGDNDDVISFLSACIVATSEKPRFDTRLAWESAKKTADRAKADSRWQQFARWRLGWAWYHLGERDKAVSSIQSAQEAIRRLKGTIDFDHLEAECDEALRTMQGHAAASQPPP